MNLGFVTNTKARLIGFARSYVLDILGSGIKTGQLEIIELEGDSITLGPPESNGIKASICVLDNTFYWRILMSNDLGFSESYMLGEFETEDLRLVARLYIENAPQLNGLSTLVHKIFSGYSSVSSYLFGRSAVRARLNAIAGYDGSNAMFQAFLSEEMMYSCALWGDEQGGPHGDLHGNTDERALETAQMRKIHHVLKLARIKKGDRVLEVGSGWCGLAIEAVRKYGCTVDTVTLSVEQKRLGEERIRAAGLTSSVHVHLLDFRELPESFKGAFDAFISIEMIEHVGPLHYETYFERVDWALKPHHAAAVISSSTLPEARYSAIQTPDFSRHYMWPNGSLPSATSLITAACSASDGRLTLDTVENHGQHYPRTLREWDRRFKERVSGEVMREIVRQQPGLSDAKKLDAFMRKWLYLFPTAEAGFSKGYLTCHMLTFVRDMDLASRQIEGVGK
ncbi:hypothetical protein CERSUDRAFT_115708 [Gelatoporia subvermispora B]|uniref:Cyclopropane-fatty-acyl-phospholipid synthase n=1 Tax=Ceriporiopsis subvermispora (strain B) TaxID=914234 RepID=M2QFC7_CERS8|nr:hypothetical protein CERSUDRAFT_115708 [Gelatoporia subvermispora B]